MLDVKFIRNNFDQVKQRLGTRYDNSAGKSSVNLLDDFEMFDREIKPRQIKVEGLRYERGLVFDKIGQLRKNGEAIDKEIAQTVEMSKEIDSIDNEIRQRELNLNENILLRIPNLPDESVPIGKTSEDNQEVKKYGNIPKFSFVPKPHWEIGEALKILNFEAAAKITGSRFALYRGQGAKLERALINFMLDLHTKEHGYIEILPPFMVNSSSMTGTGQLPKFKEDLFKCEGTDYYLIPTAEVPLTNIHRDEILNGEDLPVAYTAYTPCFRAEAGAYGKDVRGLIRQHQFNKVELVKFVKPEESSKELEKLLLDAERVLQLLQLPYRVIELCTGDLGFAASKTYDIEVWLPAQECYREISSCSNFGDFQARRAMIRFKREKNSKSEFVHTLNGSGLAIGRTLVSILENYQQKDGSVIIPDVLQKYMNGEEMIIKRRIF